MLVRLSKSWNRLEQIANSIPRLSRDINEGISRRLAEEYRSMVIAHLESQDIPWVPLSDAYYEWKIAMGLDPRTWISTGQLMRAITIIENPGGSPGGRTSYFIGIPPDARNEHGTSIALIAMVLEYGSPVRGIPARPLFRHTFHELRQRMYRIARETSAEALENFKKRGYQ